MAQEPKRPANLPEKAFWQGSKSRWEMGEYKSGKPSGEWCFWRKDGLLWMEMNFNDRGVFEGGYKRYHPDGTLAQEGNYINGKLDGWVKYYRVASGKSSNEPFPSEAYNYQIVRAEILHLEGRKLASRYYIANGQQVDTYARQKPKNIDDNAWWNNRDYLWEHGEFNKEAKKIGKWNAWRFAGSLASEANYNNEGQLHGEYKRYHDNGTLAQEGHYLDGKEAGAHTFYRSLEYSQESHMGNLNVKIWKHVINYVNGNAQSDQYFTKKDELCSSKGFPLVDAKVDDLFDGDTDRFLFDRFETYLNRMASGNLKPSNLEQKNKRAALFRTYWGIELPDDLAYYFDLVERADHPILFGGYETALPKLDKLEAWTKAGKNVMETTIMDMQEWYPFDFMLDWMTGAIALDPLLQNLDKGKYYHISYHYGLYAQQGTEGKGLIYTHEHNNYYTWSTNFNQVMAENLSNLIYGLTSLSAYGEYDLLNRAQFTTIYNDKLSDKLKPSYSFLNGMKIGNRWLYESDFSYHSTKKPSISNFERSRWILELLRGETDVSNVFYSFYRNQAYKPKASDHQALLSKLPNDLPEALYHLWAAFWRKGFEAQLLDYIGVCKSSNSKIISDTAILVEQLLQGKNQLGILRDVAAMKTQFNAL